MAWVVCVVTLWTLRFPSEGDCFTGCEWIEVMAQGVPPHIGSPTPGAGYEEGDPFAAFLPHPIRSRYEITWPFGCTTPL